MMKKILILITLVLVLFTNCGAKEKDATTTPEAAKTEESATTIHLTKEEFLKKVVNYETDSKEWKYLGDKPCIVDFYATWCGPCKRIAPVLEELAAEYKGQIYIYKIDTDQEKELASVFGIQSIPTLYFVPMAGAPQMAQGALSKDEFKKAIDELLLKKK